jgi:uncharacterized protein (DUF2141 family)
MKHLPTCIALAAACLAPFSARAQTCAPVEVRNVRPDQGMVMVAAYGDAADYGTRPLALMQLRPDRPTLNFSVCGITGPAFALSTFQDLNRNGKLDTNVLGVPSEPWGASGKPSNFEAPNWKTTSVTVDGQPVVVPLSK